MRRIPLVSSQLLINIFEKNTPLHDGAIIVRGSCLCNLLSATVRQPGTEQGSGETRHRAAVGISEVSDSLTIVVSEETGKVSLRWVDSCTVMWMRSFCAAN